jgi:hypothetical protein
MEVGQSPALFSFSATALKKEPTGTGLQAQGIHPLGQRRLRQSHEIGISGSVLRWFKRFEPSSIVRGFVDVYQRASI